MCGQVHFSRTSLEPSLPFTSRTLLDTQVQVADDVLWKELHRCCASSLVRPNYLSYQCRIEDPSLIAERRQTTCSVQKQIRQSTKAKSRKRDKLYFESSSPRRSRGASTPHASVNARRRAGNSAASARNRCRHPFSFHLQGVNPA